MRCIKLYITIFLFFIVTGINYSQNADSTFNVDTAFININNVKFIHDNYGDIGNYFVTLRAGSELQTIKVSLLK